MTNDNIADMLTRIRNATLAKHGFSKVIYSKINLSILKVLLAEGYISKFTLETENDSNWKKEGQKIIKIYLKYKGWWIKRPFFTTIQRISKPGKRVFSSYKNFNDKINILRYNQGIAIISTSSGVMSHIKASQLKKGGEILCYIG